MFEIHEKYVKNTQPPCKHKKRNIHTCECMTDIPTTNFIYMQVKALEEQEHAVGKGGVHDIVCVLMMSAKAIPKKNDSIKIERECEQIKARSDFKHWMKMCWRKITIKK